MPQNRRRFLEALGGTSLLAAGAPLGAMSAAAANTSHPSPVADTWDVSWADRVQQAKYRAVFDSPDLSDGLALLRAMGWCNQYKEVYNTARNEMAPVVVFRHNGIDLIMNDEYWKKYKIGKANKVKTMMGKTAEANPIGSPQVGAPPPFATVSIQNFIKDGGIVLACNWAFADVIGRVAKGEKLDESAATERAKAQIIPGVILQPSGVFAALRAQEAGCRYFIAS